MSGNARGRPKGSRNKRTRALINEAAEAAGETPLQYMLRIMRDQNAPARRRDEMAKAAAPYLHSKLNAVDAKPNEPGKSEHPRIRVEFVRPRPRHEDDEEVAIGN
jgi:hypothetical protein